MSENIEQCCWTCEHWKREVSKKSGRVLRSRPGACKCPLEDLTVTVPQALRETYNWVDPVTRMALGVTVWPEDAKDKGTECPLWRLREAPAPKED